jgi:hypothetical protein
VLRRLSRRQTPPKDLSRKRCEATSRYTLPRSQFELVLMPLSDVVVASITLCIQMKKTRHTSAKREPIKGLRLGIHQQKGNQLNLGNTWQAAETETAAAYMENELGRKLVLARKHPLVKHSISRMQQASLFSYFLEIATTRIVSVIVEIRPRKSLAE